MGCKFRRAGVPLRHLHCRQVNPVKSHQVPSSCSSEWLQQCVMSTLWRAFWIKMPDSNKYLLGAAREGCQVCRQPAAQHIDDERRGDGQLRHRRDLVAQRRRQAGPARHPRRARLHHPPPRELLRVQHACQAKQQSAKRDELLHPPGAHSSTTTWRPENSCPATRHSILASKMFISNMALICSSGAGTTSCTTPPSRDSAWQLSYCNQAP